MAGVDGKDSIMSPAEPKPLPLLLSKRGSLAYVSKRPTTSGSESSADETLAFLDHKPATLPGHQAAQGQPAAAIQSVASNR